MSCHITRRSLSRFFSRQWALTCFMLILGILMLMYAHETIYNAPVNNSMTLESNNKVKNVIERVDHELIKDDVNLAKEPKTVVAINTDMVETTKPYIQTRNDLKTVISSVNSSILDTKLKQRLPKCIIIGSKKSGTGSLIFFLREHPKIAASQYEPHYFDNRSRHFDLGLEWYRRKLGYSLPDQLTIEKSPSYFITKETPKRIYDFDKDMKLILIVRNPVTRVKSDYSHRKGDWIRNKAKGKDYPFYSFEEFAINSTTKKVNENWKPIMVSRYSDHIANWYRYFSRSQIHIANGEELIKNPFSVLREVEKFLNLKPWFEDKHFVYNPVRGFYCFKTKCLDRTKGRSHPEVSDGVIDILQEYFRPYNEKFNELTGKKFSWY